MAFIYFGTKKAIIGFEEFMVSCTSCEGDSFADVMIYSNYFHIYFIPIFPFSKEANIICKSCGLKRYNIPLKGIQFIKNFEESKSRFKHPWYTYIVPALIGISVLTILFF